VMVKREGEKGLRQPQLPPVCGDTSDAIGCCEDDGEQARSQPGLRMV